MSQSLYTNAMSSTGDVPAKFLGVIDEGIFTYQRSKASTVRYFWFFGFLVPSLNDDVKVVPIPSIGENTRKTLWKTLIYKNYKRLSLHR